ncbi:MAG TPA: hypothetical protein VM324_08580 [Egibacteraceae bacterium]|jgi:hypothetical protein|nr:hypothetical protein [Egibacteraceae bacterium]
MSTIERAVATRRAYRAKVDEIKASDLTPGAKRAQLEELYHRTQAELRGLRRQHDTAQQEAAARLTRRLFAAPGKPAYRDAVTAVTAQVKTRDDYQLVARQAEITGDDLLAKAAASVAHANGWSREVSEYAERSGQTDTLDALRAQQATANDPTHRLHLSIGFNVARPT